MMILRKDQIIALIEEAFDNDVPLTEVMEAIEKSILYHAIQRHDRVKDAIEGLRIPRTSFFAKKRKYGLSISDR